MHRGQSRIVREHRAHTSLVILANLAAAMSPDITPSRKLGLFLSFKLTNKERILALYPPLLEPSSSATAFSIATALWAIRSLAIGGWGLDSRGNRIGGERTSSRIQCKGIVEELDAPVTSLISCPAGVHSVTLGGPCLDFRSHRGRSGRHNGVDFGRSGRRNGRPFGCYKWLLEVIHVRQRQGTHLTWTQRASGFQLCRQSPALPFRRRSSTFSQCPSLSQIRACPRAIAAFRRRDQPCFPVSGHDEVRWGGVLGRRRWVAHPKNSFIYVWLLLQSTQNFYDRLRNKNTMGEPESLSTNGIILPLRPGRFEVT